MINNKTKKKLFTLETAASTGNQFCVSLNNNNHEQFMTGLEIEHQHGLINPEVTPNDLIMSGKVVIARFNDFPDYYDNTEKVKNNLTGASVRFHKRYAVDATADSIVDPPFTETYGSSYKQNGTENRRDNKIIKLDD